MEYDQCRVISRIWSTTVCVEQLGTISIDRRGRHSAAFAHTQGVVTGRLKADNRNQDEHCSYGGCLEGAIMMSCNLSSGATVYKETDWPHVV